MRIIKKFFYDFFTIKKKITSISVKFCLVNNNMQEVSSKVQTFEIEHPLDNIFKQNMEMIGWDVANKIVKRFDVKLRKIANDFLNDSKKRKRVENKRSILETEIIKGVNWGLEDYEKEYLSYDEYLELKTKGALN